MPNHVKNIIQISMDTPPAQVDAIFQHVLSDDDNSGLFFDFNKLIPMPQTLDLVSGTDTDLGLAIYQMAADLPCKTESWVTTRIWQAFEEAGIDRLMPNAIQKFIGKPHGKSLWELGKKAFENKLAYGAATWYEWCIREWGTKWNSYENEINKANRRISFSTAWNCPSPIVDAFTKAFPHVDFTWKYADEDCGYNVGIYRRENGAYSFAECIALSDEAYQMYVDCWGAGACMYQDERGAWRRYSCDECPHPC